MKVLAKKKLVIMGVAAVAAMVLALGLAACGGQGASGGKSHDDLRAAFEQDNIVKVGVVSDAYVEKTPYEVTDFAVTEESETEHGFTYKVDAVIENESFTSTLSLTCERRGEIITFDLLDDSSVAKKGIDFDTEHGIGDAQSTLSEDGKSCTVHVESPYDYWFIEGSTEATYTYKFNGEAWVYDDMRPGADYTFKKDIEGEYACPAGESPQYSGFAISDVDPDKGTFAIKFTQNALAPVAGGDIRCQEARAELTAGITFEECADGVDGRMDNGMLYSFEAQGTTDAGGQVAEMKGYLSVDAEGNPIMVLTSSKVDAIATGSWGDPFEKLITVRDYVMTKE